MLHRFVTRHGEQIVLRCKAKVAKRSSDPGGRDGSDTGIPMFLGQLVETLTHPDLGGEQITATAVRQGRDLLSRGFAISEVAHDYGDVCQAITELALEESGR